MEVTINVHGVKIIGDLEIADGKKAIIIFAHGTGSDRFSVRNNYVASELRKAGFSTLLFDLLTKKEDLDRSNTFNTDLLAERLIAVTKWCMENELLVGYKFGYFGASTGAAAALSASAYWGTKIFAVVCRGGRPDLASEELDLVESPTLLIVGGEDKDVILLNRMAYSKLGSIKKMEIVPGATHVFEEEGAMEKVISLSIDWFEKHFENRLK